jgi:hypothetical protein
MRRLTILLAIVTVFVAVSAAALAQENNYTGADYQLELPSAKWRVMQEPDNLHENAEFIFGDRNDGYLRIRKEVVDAGTRPEDLLQRDQDQKLHFQTGYIEGKSERFAGRLTGMTYGYEYTAGGKAMAGRLYYLQADPRTIYVLRFTALRDKLVIIRNQTDSIARSFKMK